MNGIVFSTEEFSIYDGPGIRTTVFLKGCPLRCSWCHNPEGQRMEPQIVRSPNGCIGCGQCERNAEPTEDGMRYTERSIQSCPQHLLRVSGEALDAQELTQRLLKNERLLRKGGVTFSGGEPLLQSEFVLECLSLLQGRLHTAVQTCGYCDEATFHRVLDAADYMLFDLKVMDEARHIRYTGVSNAPILRNFEVLARSGKPFVVRIPLIPGVTDTGENIESICGLLNAHGVAYAELLPYNKMAGGKYALVGRHYEPDFDETIPINPREKIFAAHGITIKTL